MRVKTPIYTRPAGGCVAVIVREVYSKVVYLAPPSAPVLGSPSQPADGQEAGWDGDPKTGTEVEPGILLHV